MERKKGCELIQILQFRFGSRYCLVFMELLTWLCRVSHNLHCIAQELRRSTAIAGYFADKSSSRRLPLLFGLCALMASTTMYCFGTNIAILGLARFFQGAAAAIVQVVGLALLSDTMGATNSGGAMGYQAIALSMGTIFGPALGGLVYDLAGHFAVFGMAFAILLVDILLRLLMIERNVAMQWLASSSGLQSGTTEVSTSRAREVSTSKGKGIPPGILSLLKTPRLLVAFWFTFVCSVVMTAFESVRNPQIIASNQFWLIYRYYHYILFIYSLGNQLIVVTYLLGSLGRLRLYWEPWEPGHSLCCATNLLYISTSSSIAIEPPLRTCSKFQHPPRR
jgi:MFS family permease